MVLSVNAHTSLSDLKQRQQETDNVAGQGGAASSPGQYDAGKPSGDNVTLTRSAGSASEKNTAPDVAVEPLHGENVDQVLQQTMQGILRNSTTSVPSQANQAPQSALGLLDDK